MVKGLNDQRLWIHNQKTTTKRTVVRSLTNVVLPRRKGRCLSYSTEETF